MAVATRECFGTFPLSTNGVPEADRIAVWREGIGRVMRLDVEALPDVSFHADLAMRILPGLGIISGQHSPLRVGRSRTLVADGNDDLVLLVRTGPGVLIRCNREIPVGSDESILLSTGDVGGYVFTSQARVLALDLPRAPLKPLLSDVDVTRLGPVPRNDALRLLENYLTVMGNDQALINPELRRAVVAHVYDLVALAIGATGDAADRAGGRGLRAARLCAIKADIAGRLHQGSDVSIGKLAAHQRVTPRYIQMLFEGEGTTFTQFVLAERLARAHRMLINPNLPDRGIASVAFDAGFGDLSYFTRSFRRAYGARPSEVRDQAAG
jgi:AraC-like DNA-binding protein